MRKILLILIFLTIPLLVSAGVISLTTTVSTDVMIKNTAQVRIELLNSGDEAAYNVQLSLISDYFDSEPFHVGNLEPKKPFETNMSISLKDEIKPGNYPVVLLTEYADANDYRFSSVSPVALTYKNPSVSLVSGSFSEVSLSGKKSKTLTLTVSNRDDVLHDVKVKLILPRELKIDEDEKSVSITGKEEKKLNFKVSNFAGLEGSSYVVLASIEYEDDVHYSSFARGMIKIGDEENQSRFSIWIPVIIFLALLLIFLYLKLKGRELKIEFQKK